MVVLPDEAQAHAHALTYRLPAGAARLRPSIVPRTTLPALTSLTQTTTRPASNGPSNVPEDPAKTKAQSIIDALPGNSLISKSAILSSAAGLSVYAISNEYYIVNEESIVAFCLLSVWGALIAYGGPMYKEWAKAHQDRVKGVLDQARADHLQAVKDRIANVQQLAGVVDVTKALFAVSKVHTDMPALARYIYIYFPISDLRRD